jgi:PhoH-like ATPase
MPLPKPPAKRAALLNPAEFDAQAAPKPTKRSAAQASSSTATEPSAELNLYDPRPQTIPHPAPPRASAPSVTAKAPTPQAKARPAKSKPSGPPKLFVLDTNVLMHDPMSLFRFEEHDIYLPMITLEELDGHKKGMTEVARNARQVSRDLDGLAVDMGTRDANGMTDGLPLSRTGHREALGKVFFQTCPKAKPTTKSWAW